MDPDKPAALLHLDNNPESVKEWTMQTFIPDPGYMAAVAVERHDLEFKFWKWNADCLN